MKKIIMTILALMLTSQIANWYDFNGKNYDIQYPENIEYLEYCYHSNQCPVPKKYEKLIYLNWLLIKYGYNPIW